jgi:hypothetical protein
MLEELRSLESIDRKGIEIVIIEEKENHKLN